MNQFENFEGKPKALKKLQGTYRKDRDEKGNVVSMPVKEVPKPLSWVCTEGKKVFKELAPKLVERKILQDLDVPMLNAACHQFGKFVQYEKFLKKEGTTTEIFGVSPTGGEPFLKGVVARPEVKLSKTAFDFADKTFKYFGLNPLDRSKLHIPDMKTEEEAKNSFNQFMLRKNG